MRGRAFSNVRMLAAAGVVVIMPFFAMRVDAAPITYQYTGIPFTFCGFGCPGTGFQEENAPANWADDYLTASLTFADPLPANMPLTEVSSLLTAWSINDALGFVALSSAFGDVLTGWEGVGPLVLATNSSGNIASYLIGTGPSEGSVGPIAILVNPPVACEECGPGIVLADFIAPNFGNDELEWNAASGTPGQWTTVAAIPEPATLILTGLGLGGIAARRHRRRFR